VPPANPREAEAGPSHVLPFPYDDEEVIGGDSIQSIRDRLVTKWKCPSDKVQYDFAEIIKLTQIEAEDLFEVKTNIIRGMASLDPEGDWERRGARALDNPRTKTGEESLEKLHAIYDKLRQHDSETILELKNKMVFRRRDEDSESIT